MKSIIVNLNSKIVQDWRRFYVSIPIPLKKDMNTYKLINYLADLAELIRPNLFKSIDDWYFKSVKLAKSSLKHTEYNRKTIMKLAREEDELLREAIVLYKKDE